LVPPIKKGVFVKRNLAEFLLKMLESLEASFSNPGDGEDEDMEEMYFVRSDNVPMSDEEIDMQCVAFKSSVLALFGRVPLDIVFMGDSPGKELGNNIVAADVEKATTSFDSAGCLLHLESDNVSLIERK
jgi:hypothetical protein